MLIIAAAWNVCKRSHNTYSELFSIFGNYSMPIRTANGAFPSKIDRNQSLSHQYSQNSLVSRFSATILACCYCLNWNGHENRLLHPGFQNRSSAKNQFCSTSMQLNFLYLNHVKLHILAFCSLRLNACKVSQVENILLASCMTKWRAFAPFDCLHWWESHVLSSL